MKLTLLRIGRTVSIAFRCILISVPMVLGVQSNALAGNYFCLVSTPATADVYQGVYTKAFSDNRSRQEIENEWTIWVKKNTHLPPSEAECAIDDPHSNTPSDYAGKSAWSEVAWVPANQTSTSTTVASGGKAQYEWCWTAPLDNRNQKMFYSKVFAVVPMANQERIMHGFRDFVRDQYPSDNTGPGECNGPYATEDVAKSYLNQYRTNSRDFNNLQIIDTYWSP
jgi:hypothetical protein